MSTGVDGVLIIDDDYADMSATLKQQIERHGGMGNLAAMGRRLHQGTGLDFLYLRQSVAARLPLHRGDGIAVNRLMTDG